MFFCSWHPDRVIFCWYFLLCFDDRHLLNNMICSVRLISISNILLSLRTPNNSALMTHDLNLLLGRMLDRSIILLQLWTRYLRVDCFDIYLRWVIYLSVLLRLTDILDLLSWRFYSLRNITFSSSLINPYFGWISIKWLLICST